MLFRSQDNLLAGIESFIELADSITLFSAYLKLSALEHIDSDRKIKRIIVRWSESDLCGPHPSSDIDVFQYCDQNNITLLRNRKLHIKALWNDDAQIMVGSANITNNGLALGREGNLELNAIETRMSREDVEYLNDIIQTSEIVDADLYHRLKDLVDRTPVPEVEIEQIEGKTADPFLLTQLPSFQNIETMHQAYLNPEASSNADALIHDLKLYRIPAGLKEEPFYHALKSSFNSHPFTRAFVRHLSEEADFHEGAEHRSMRWTDVRLWIENKTSSTRLPHREEMKVIVNTWYNWLVFCDDCIRTDQQDYTQLLHYNPRN